MDQTQLEALKSLVSHTYSDEADHYQEAGQPPGHIFESVQVLQNYLVTEKVADNCADCGQLLGLGAGVCMVCGQTI